MVLRVHLSGRIMSREVANLPTVVRSLLDGVTATSDRRTSHRGRWRFLVALGAGLVLLWLNGVIAQWSSRTGVFISAVGLVFALLILAEWVLSAIWPPAWRFTRSVAASMWSGAASDSEVQAFKQRHPRWAAWLGSRTTLSKWSGLYLTVTIASTVYFLVNLVSVARRAVVTSLLTGYDTQLSGLLRAFRTPDLTHFLWVFTILGDSRVAFAMTAIVAVLFLLWGRRLDALLIAVAVVGGAVLGELTKTLFHRARPGAAMALIKESSSFSLPSGHALYALVFWGVMAFLLVRASSTTMRKLMVLAFCLGMIAMTGLSRIYLGVHWPSDVLASWMLGLAWLSPCIGAYLMWTRYGRSIDGKPVGTIAVRRVIVGFALAAIAGIVVVGASADPLLRQAVASAPRIEWLSSVDASGLPAPARTQVQALPRVSQKLDGTPQEPIGLVFIGTERQLVGAFTQAGWSVADTPSPLSLLHALVAAYSNQPYATGPVTPSFIDGQVQNISFEKPEGQATVRRRHHCRWWKTNYTFRGRPVWVATASYDTSLEIGSAIPVLTHHIAPDIDAEQMYIVRDLKAVGVEVAGRVRVSPASSGTNAQGDQWFTHGLATVLVAPR